VHQVVGPDGRSHKVEGAVECGELAPAVVATEQEAVAALLNQAARQGIIDSDNRPFDRWQLSFENVSDFSFRVRVLISAEPRKNRQHAHRGSRRRQGQADQPCRLARG
jgi:hypothetical protein